jgi:hypothetical protein
MSFSALADNQCVSYNNLQSGVNQGYFDAKTTIPATNQESTKSAAYTYVDIDPNYPPFASKLDNQLVVKRDLKDNVAVIEISNNFFEGTITDVTVNGVSIYGASFPLDIGNGTQGYTDQLGTYDIVLYYADANMPSNYARCYDSNYNTVCVDGFSSTGPGPYYVTFSSQSVSTIYPVSIVTGDGSCVAPVPPQIGDQPAGSVAVNRGSGQYMAMAVSDLQFASNSRGGGIFVSSNYGSTWTFRAFINYWGIVRMSDNGQYMIAAPYYGQAYVSSDYGVNWSTITSTVSYGGNTLTVGFGSITDVSISGDGQYMIILNQTGSGTLRNNYAFLSSNYGSTWSVTKFNSFDDKPFYGVDMSSNGAYMFLAKQGEVLRSTNYGSSWTSVTGFDASLIVQDVKCVADGSKVIAAKTKSTFGINTQNPDYLMTSSDYGSSWSNVTSGSGSLKAWSVCEINTSSSGTGYGISDTRDTALSLTSTYIGKTNSSSFSDLTSAGLRIWTSIANSDDGQYVIAGAYNGLFLSSNYGSTFSQIT